MSRDWKETLFMPETPFEMKGNLATKEPEFRQFWEENKIYEKALKANKENGKGRFILHDGPPYANGSLHVGHALNKVLKDIIVRRKTLEGYYSPFVLGWDTHGLPIENKMLNELNMSKDDLDQVTLRKKATEYALKQIDIQKEQFSRMQLFTDLSKVYKTLDKSFEAKQLELFKKMALDGLVYKGLKPVFWSPSSQSALAEAEVEYEDHVSPQVIVAFKIKEGNAFLNENDNLLIMTTTPWTLIANSGVAVGVDFDYDIVKFNNQNYVVASQLTKNVAELAKWDNYEVVKTVKGKELLGITYTRPIKKELLAKVVPGFHVTTDAGTGLVHMAPLFGEEDYQIGKEFNLDMIMHVDAKGNFNDQAGEFANLFYVDANKVIGQKLDSEGVLLSIKFLKHSYPHDWRTHKPVIYRGVPQWFVNIKKIKDDIKSALKEVKSTPEWGVSRIEKMIESREEWTISRQRTWGVPIIVFYDEKENPVIKEEIFDYVINLVKQHGTDIWWEKSTDELLPPEYRNLNWTREMDIMDVWFDSGSSSIAVQIEEETAPFEMYLEGSDQYRGWFNSSLINSVAFCKKAPFKNLLSHGFVLDGKQQKMSKSKGNVVDPLDVIKNSGAEVLRLWSANCEFTSDVSISDDILKQNIEIYRRIRNTFKYMLGNLKDFDYAKNKVELKQMHQYVANVINNYGITINKFYNEYRFIDIVKETNKLLIDLSGWYFEYAKDILYCDHLDSYDRRAIQTNIFNLVSLASLALAPILPTTMEEVYRYFNKENKKESIFLENIQENSQEITQDKTHLNIENTYRVEANKVLEEARKNGIIKRNNEAVLRVNIPAEDRIGNEKLYAQYFIVAKVIFDTKWSVETFESEKCQRCWNHFDKGSLNEESICSRCEDVVKKAL